MLWLMILTEFLKIKDSNHDHFSTLNVVISQTVTDRAIITIVNEYEVAYWLRFMYLHLTLAHSKGQSYGHANLGCEYLENGD